MLHTPTLWHTEEGGGGRRAEARDDNLHRMILLARCSIHLSQALAEALTSSKAMVGRRLLQCSDLSKCINYPWPVGRECVGFEGQCNQIVSGVTATWSALVDAAEKATEVARETAAVAAAAAIKKLNEVKDAAAKKLNEVKDAAAEKLNEVKKELEDAASAVTGWFTELEDDIKCAHPLHSPRGSPLCAMSANSLAHGVVAFILVEFSYAMWQECLRRSGEHGRGFCKFCH